MTNFRKIPNFKKAQGALEYLLILGAAVLISVIVIALLVGMGGQSRDTAQNQATQSQKVLEQPQPASIISVIGLKETDKDLLVQSGLDESVNISGCYGKGGSAWFKIDWQELGVGGIHTLKIFNNQNIEIPENKFTVYNLKPEDDIIKTNPPQLTENIAVVYVEELLSNCFDTYWIEIETEKNGQKVKSTRAKFYWPENLVENNIIINFHSNAYFQQKDYFDITSEDINFFVSPHNFSNINYDWNLTGTSQDNLDNCSDNNYCILNNTILEGGFYNIILKMFSNSSSLEVNKEFVVVSSELESNFNETNIEIDLLDNLSIDAELSGSLSDFEGKYNCFLVHNNNDIIASKLNISSENCVFSILGNQIGTINNSYDINLIVEEIRTGRTINKASQITITEQTFFPIATILSPIQNSSFSCEENVLFNLNTENITSIDNNYWYLNKNILESIDILPDYYSFENNNQSINITDLLASSELNFGDNNVSSIVVYNTNNFLKSNTINFNINNLNCNSDCIIIDSSHPIFIRIYLVNTCSENYTNYNNYTFSFSSNKDGFLIEDGSFTNYTGINWNLSNSRIRINKNDLSISSGVHIFTFSYYDENGNLIALNSKQISI
jgi:hypothetical protein